jgi:hypothetical protein
MVWMDAGQSLGSDGSALVELVRHRTFSLWIDGDAIDEIVLNSRGKLTFLYIDNKLGREIGRLRKPDSSSGPSTDVPEVLFLYSTKYNKKGRVLLTAQLQVYKSLSFDPEKMSVAGYSLKKSDILTGIGSNPSAEIRPGVKEFGQGYSGYMGFYVPAEYVKPGEEITVSYDGFATKWRVPLSNQ